jgi:hypothetical protein
LHFFEQQSFLLLHFSPIAAKVQDEDDDAFERLQVGAGVSLLGTFVGDMERLQEGIIDGVDVGTAVEGKLVRVQVGKSDGTCEGTPVVGTLLGAFVGALVGGLVGAAVGSSLHFIITGGLKSMLHTVLSNRWAKQDH